MSIQKTRKQTLKKIREHLPKNWAKTLADKTTFSARTIEAVLYGRRFNTIIIDEALKLAEETDMQNLQRKQKIENLCDSQPV